MAKFIKNDNGVYKEEVAVATSAGAADSGKVPALNGSGVLDSTIVNSTVSSAGAGDAGKLTALDSAGKLDITTMPTGVGADTKSIVASEALTAGNVVNVWDNSGTVNVRKADASSASVGKRAVGYVLANVSNSASATVYFDGTITGLSGLTIGVPYYLSGTAGAITPTAPTTSGYTVQEVGWAISATELSFEPMKPLLLA